MSRRGVKITRHPVSRVLTSIHHPYNSRHRNGDLASGGSPRMADRVIFVCTLVLAAVYLYATEQLPSLEIGDPLGPKAFPRLLGAGLVLTAIVMVFEMVRARKTAAG